MQNPAARMLLVEKTIKTFKEEVKCFSAEAEGSLDSIKNSERLIAVERAKWTRYTARVDQAKAMLVNLEAEMICLKKTIDRTALKDRRAELLAELAEINTLVGTK